MIGRDAEIHRIRSFLVGARTDGGALLVIGEPGVGKTELLNAASAMASAAGTRILRASGVEFEAGISYAGLNQVLLPLLGTLPQLPAIHREALNVALGFGAGPPPSRLVVSTAALVLLREAIARDPLLVIIDDVPWLDEASAGVLSFVARRVPGTGIGFLAAYRTGAETAFERAGLPELDVQRLDPESSGQLLDERFADLEGAVRERILLEAQGNPLALLELPVALGPALRASGTPLPAALPLGRRLQALYGSRIAELPPSTRALLLLMALDGTGDVRLLEAGGYGDAGGGDFGQIERARLAYLDEATHRLTFHHPLIRAAVVELAEPRERRSAHRVLADVWASQPDRRVWHLAEATLDADESVAAELEAAAARILARGDALGCVRALTRASEMSPRPADRQRRLAAAAYVGADVAGDLTNATRVLAGLRRDATGGDGSLEAAITAAVSLLQRDGDVATAHRVLTTAIAGVDGDLDASDRVIAESLFTLMMVCRYASDAGLWSSFERAIARCVSLPLVLDVSRQTFANPTFTRVEALEQLDSLIAGLGDEADPTQIVWIGRAATYVDRVEGCRPALWRLVHDARKGGAVASGISALFLLARDDFEAGEWDEADALAGEAADVCSAHGYHALIWPCRYLQSLVAAGRGDHERALALTDELIRWTGPRGLRVGEWFVAETRALVALGRGAFDEAFRLASSASPPGRLEPFDPAVLYLAMDLVESAVRTGRMDEARAHVAAMQEAELPALSSRLALVVGGAAAMVEPDATSLGAFQATLALPGIDRWQFRLARVRLAYGERLRRLRATTEARTELEAALETFVHLGARPWAERATSELTATARTKPRRRGHPDRLTPQEFEIAKLAASGLTNKQIATRLFVSPRTVGGHLHQAFPKLGIATRAGLRDALERLPREGRPTGD